MDQNTVVMPILLQHPAVTENSHIYCSLLCASKTVRNAVTAQCRGALAIDHMIVTQDQLNSFAAWLKRHCTLLKSLSLQLPDAAEDHQTNFPLRQTEIAAVLAAAMAPSTDCTTHCTPQASCAAAAAVVHSLSAAAAAAAAAAATAAAAAPLQTDAGPHDAVGTAAGESWTVILPGNSPGQEQQQQQHQQCPHQAEQQQRQHHDTVLQLQSLVISYASSALLKQMPAAALTSLDFVTLPTEHPGKVAAAVAQLTGLHSLAMSLHRTNTAPKALRKWKQRSTTLIAAVNANFSRLKTLKLRNWADLGGLQDLPPQLKELHVHFPDSIFLSLTAAHGLSRLTLLTELSISGLCFGPLAVESGSTSSSGGSWCQQQQQHQQQLFPSSLRRLNLPNCQPTVEPLLGLQDLQHLVMTCTTVPGQQLLQLGKALPRLMEVRLEYECDGVALSAAPGWTTLPVKDLLFDDTVSTAVLASVGQLSGLTCLRVYDVDATPWQVAAALQQLTALKELFLHAFAMSHKAAVPEPAVGAQGMALLLEVIASRPALSHLVLGASLGVLHYQQWSEGLGWQLGAATQLQVLHLAYCGLTDSTVMFLTQHLRGLQELALNSNRQVSDEVLPCIASHLVRLTELDVRDTAVTTAGLQHLQSILSSGGHTLLVRSG